MKKRFMPLVLALILAATALLPLQASAAEVPKTVLAYSYGIVRGDTEVTQYAYDAKGNLVWEHMYDSNNHLNTYQYEYSADGVLEQKTHTAEGFVLSSMNGTFVTRYNTHGDVLEDTLQYAYDALGRKVKETRTREANSTDVISEVTYTYNTDGSYAKETLEYDENGDLTSRLVESYDAGNKPISLITESIQEKLVTEYTHQYDEHGNKTQAHYVEITDGKETLTVTLSYKNIYDAKGNLILALHSSESSDPEQESSGMYTSYDYDEKGRCVRITYAYDGNYSFEAWEYDADGNKVAYAKGTDEGLVDEIYYVYLPLKDVLYEE